MNSRDVTPGTLDPAALFHPGNPAVDVRGVTVRYGDIVAIDDVSVSLYHGRVCGLIGPNGSGKSTLMKAIMGLVKPDTGSVSISAATKDVPEPERMSVEQARTAGRIAYVPQHEAVDWSFPVSVHDVVMMGRYPHLGPRRTPRQADEHHVTAALERVQLSDFASRQIGQLSGGQRKRVFVARAIAQGADVIILDEPFAGVDRPSEEVLTVQFRMMASEGAALCVATHELGRLRALADDVILLQRQVLMHAATDEVLRPEHLVPAFGLAVINEAAANHAEASVAEPHRGGPSVSHEPQERGGAEC